MTKASCARCGRALDVRATVCLRCGHHGPAVVEVPDNGGNLALIGLIMLALAVLIILVAWHAS